MTRCFPGTEPPAGRLSAPLISYIFHVKIHKGFIGFGGGGESRRDTSQLRGELAEGGGARGGDGGFQDLVVALELE